MLDKISVDINGWAAYFYFSIEQMRKKRRKQKKKSTTCKCQVVFCFSAFVCVCVLCSVRSVDRSAGLAAGWPMWVMWVCRTVASCVVCFHYWFCLWHCHRRKYILLLLSSASEAIQCVPLISGDSNEWVSVCVRIHYESSVALDIRGVGYSS